MSDVPESYYIRIRTKDGGEQVLEKRGDGSKTLGEALLEAPDFAAAGALALSILADM